MGYFAYRDSLQTRNTDIVWVLFINSASDVRLFFLIWKRNLIETLFICVSQGDSHVLPS